MFEVSNKLKRAVSALLAAALIIPSGWLYTAAEAAAADPTIIYHETFASGKGAATVSGDASLTQVTGKAFDGNTDGAALYVSNRANSWDAADFKFSDIGLEDGKVYTVTVSGYVDSDVAVPDGAQVHMQAVHPELNKYGFLAGADFAAGAAFSLTKEFTVDTSQAIHLRIQSNDVGEAIPFYIGEVLITAKKATTVKEVYHETFAGGKGAAGQSGGVELTQVTGKVFDGNADGAALYVSSRANSWDAVDFKFSDIGLQNGKTYTVTASVYVDAGVEVPNEAQAFLQAVHPELNKYGFLAGADFVAGASLLLTKEFTVDTSQAITLRIQSNDAGKAVPFYIGDIRITEITDEEETPRAPALDFTTITFEDQTAGGFARRGDTEVLTITDEDNHTENGSFALKVEGRTKTWHGPSLRVEKYVDKGHEYKISLWVKLIEPASSQLQLSTQIGDGSGANYVTLSAKTINASDGWVQYEGSYRYNNVSSEYLTIYVESSSNSTASFYIDDISFERVSTGPIAIQKDLVPIKDAYQNEFLIGNAISAEDLDGVRLELLNMHHNVATTGNAMKPDALQPTKGNFTFAAADALVDKVLAEGMQMHGHVLVWHQQSPPWMNTATDEQSNTVPLGRDEALDNLRTHIETVVDHFGDRVLSWDVVNEAMSDNPPNPSDWEASLRKSAWYNAIGPDYVEQAFLAAREVLDAHPEWDIKLYYNDYNEDNQNKAQAIYNMVKAINDKYALDNPGKLLIDGVGMQGHYNVNTNPENVRLSLEKFISLGVEISITELDIQAGSNFELSEKLANAQGYLYAQLFNLFKEHAANIARVTFWGMDDGTSWRAENNPLLFDKNLQAKPAYFGVIDPDKFIEEHEPDLTEANQSTAMHATPVIDGTIDSVWSLTPEMPINRYQMAWQGATGTAKALWDNENLYVLIQVSDAQLDKTSSNEWEQDSVEIFLDENNAKTTFYQDDDGQYRINFDNETSFAPTSIAEGFESATNVSGTSYTVEVKIPFKHITPSNNLKLGFDVQINDAKDGARQSVAAWNDTTGTGYMDTSVFGVLTLASQGGGGTGGGSSGSGGITTKNGIVTITPPVKNESGRAIGSVSQSLLSSALAQAAPAADGKKRIAIEMPTQAGASTYDVQLPAQSLQGQESFVLVIKTEHGTVEVPSGALSNVTVGADPITIRIAQASANNANEAAREAIGSRPVVDLSILTGNTVIAWNNPNAPITVTIPYTPTAEELANPDSIVVWHIADDGSVTAIPNGRYDATAKAVVFHTTRSGTYAVTSVVKDFGDLDSVPWAKQAVQAMAARDIIKGTSASSFSPASPITRADFIALLVRALELHGTDENEAMFSDVSTSAYYYQELAIAKELGIAAGFEDGTFKPTHTISRQDMMTLAARALAAAGKQTGDGGGALDGYPDEADISEYARESAAALVGAGIVNGKNGSIAPNDSLSRAEAAVILYRIWKL